MKIFAFLSFALVFFGFTNAQNIVCRSYMDSTNFYIQKKDYVRAYSFSVKALSFNDNPSPSSLYICGVLAAKNGETDLGIEFVNQAIIAGFNDYTYASQNKEFSIIMDSRWSECLKKIRKNDSIATILTSCLDTIFKRDQQLRIEWQNLEISGLKEDDPEMRRMIENISIADSIHLKAIDDIIHKYGYYGRSLRTLGSQNAIFAVVQHCNDINTQKKYFLIFREAAKRGEFHKPNLAYLEDRILLGKVGKQKYGTQYNLVDGKVVFIPFIDEKNIDEYRQDVGLEPIEKYKQRVENNL